MSNDPETVMAGLLSFFQTNSNITAAFKTIGRRVLAWDKLDGAMPALLMRLTAQEDMWPGEGLCRSELEIELWIYARTTDPDVVPESLLNSLIATVRQAIAPNDSEQLQTIGGLVYWARFEGRSIQDPGDLDGYSKASLSLRLLLPAYP